jgi:hypothetical protein
LIVSVRLSVFKVATFPPTIVLRRAEITGDGKTKKPLRLIAAEKHLHAAGGPCGDSASEKVGVLCPDGTAKRLCSCQYRAVLRIPLAEPFLGFRFKLTVNVATDHFHQGS